jgi:hypothetical protein
MTLHYDSVSKAEIQTLVAFVRRGCKVVQPLFLSHSLPLLLTRFISPNIVNLCKAVQEEVKSKDCQQLFVATFIVWSIVCVGLAELSAVIVRHKPAR